MAVEAQVLSSLAHRIRKKIRLLAVSLTTIPCGCLQGRIEMSTPGSTALKTRGKSRIKWSLIALVGLLPDIIQSLLFIPGVRLLGERLPVLRVVYTGCYRTHPIDRELGT